MRSDIEHELSQIYEMIIADHVDDIKNIVSPEERNIWAANNKATGNVRGYLNNIFQSEYLQDFENTFKGYVADDTFHATIEQGLDNIKMPEAIGVGARIEEMSFGEITYAISENIVPLIHLDPDYGYESTLNYLNRLHPQERLIEKLCNFAVGNSTPTAIATLSFLSRSNLAEEYKSLEVLKIKSVPIKLGEIASLATKELEILYITQPDKLIEACIVKNYPNLFELYYKQVGLNTEELIKGYGNEQLTPLHYTAIYGYDEIAKAILETPGIDKQKLLEIQDQNGNTVLHLVAAEIFINVEIIKVIIETPGIDKKRLLEMQNDDGKTMLKLALKYSQVDAIKILFEHQISTVGLRGSEKKAMNFLTPEDLREILKIEFSAELGEAGSTIRVEREALVLKAVHDHLKTYDTDQSWTNPNAWAASLSRMNSRVNALMGEMQDIGGIAGGVIVQREIDKVMEKIMPKSQDQSATRNNVRIANPLHQNQHAHRR